MTIDLVTFSDENMDLSAQRCAESVMDHGADKAVACWWEYIKQNWYADAPDLANASRGPAYWSWKPLVVSICMEDLKDGDILIYSDAGVEFVNNVNYIIDRMDQDIFLFGNNYEHAHWCKRDVIEEVWPYRPRFPTTDIYRTDAELADYYLRKQWENFGKQVQASVIFFRVSDYTRRFVKEWLDWCLFEGGRLIDDSPSRTPNHPEFQEHRHDQAILTTLAYREGIKLHYWPASYNDGAFTYEKLPEYASDDYPILFNHHRRRNHEWSQKQVA